MLSKRMNDLFTSMAADIEAGNAPFNHQWLVDNNVEADECFQLLEWLGTMIKGWLAMPMQAQAALYAAINVPGADAAHLLAVGLHTALIGRLDKK